MPLPSKERGITAVPQLLGNRLLLQLEVVRKIRRPQSRVASPIRRLIHSARIDVVGNTGALRIAARQDARASGTAYRASRMGRRESHPAGRQPVDVRRLIKRAAEATKISGSQIVNKKENNVRRPLKLLRSRRFAQENCQSKQDQQKGVFHSLDRL